MDHTEIQQWLDLQLKIGVLKKGVAFFVFVTVICWLAGIGYWLLLGGAFGARAVDPMFPLFISMWAGLGLVSLVMGAIIVARIRKLQHTAPLAHIVIPISKQER